jgi:hypothetical protein
MFQPAQDDIRDHHAEANVFRPSDAEISAHSELPPCLVPSRSAGRAAVRRSAWRECELLERRFVLTAATTTSFSELLNYQTGPLKNEGQNLADLYVAFSKAQKTAKAAGTLTAFNASSNPLTNNAVLTSEVGVDISGRDVGVEIRASNPKDSTFEADLTKAGVHVEHETDGVVEAMAPIGILADLAARSDVFSVTPIYRPYVAQEGIADDQANAAEDIAAASTKYMVNGAGETVGVISDSVNQVGLGLQQSVDSGDLPDNVQVIQDGLPGDTDEGRAILEEFYDTVPGANLAFCTGEGGQQAMANAINELVEQAGATVIDDDIGYPNEPMFEPGVIDDAISTVVGEGVAYFSSAGNEGFGGLEQSADFVTSGSNKLINFSQSSSSPQTRLDITVPPNDGSDSSLTLEWDSPYNGIEGSAVNSIYINVYNSAGTKIVYSGNSNSVATGLPIQVINSLAAGNYQVEIGAYGANASKTLPGTYEIGGNFSITSTGIPGHQESSFGHPANGIAIGVGAVDQTDVLDHTTPLDSESFSSAGPSMQIFSSTGVRLSSPVTLDEPLVSGVDGVTTSFFGDKVGSSYYFFGTSAAAPNVAAIGVLMQELQPGVTQSQIATALESGTTPLNGAASGTWNEQGGFGLVNALSSIADLLGSPIATIVQVTTPRTTAVDSVDINFSESVTGLTISDLSLSRNGGTNLLTSSQMLTGSGSAYVLSNLTPITATAGTYTLTLAASSSIVATGDVPLDGGASMTWVVNSGGGGSPPTPPGGGGGSSGGNAPPTAVPLAPEITGVKGYSKHSIIVTWLTFDDEDDFEDGAYAPAYLVVERSLDKNFKTGVVKMRVSAETEVDIDTGLRAGTKYYYRIYGENVIGYGPYSSTMSGATPAAKKPLA